MAPLQGQLEEAVMSAVAGRAGKRWRGPICKVICTTFLSAAPDCVLLELYDIDVAAMPGQLADYFDDASGA